MSAALEHLLKAEIDKGDRIIKEALSAINHVNAETLFPCPAGRNRADPEHRSARSGR
jgi:hypothetical protein